MERFSFKKKQHSIESRCYRTGKYNVCRRDRASFSRLSSFSSEGVNTCIAIRLYDRQKGKGAGRERKEAIEDQQGKDMVIMSIKNEATSEVSLGSKAYRLLTYERGS